MRGLIAFTVLVWALRASSLPLPESQSLTCDDEGAKAAVQVFLQHFNTHHRQGYKYTLSQIKSSTVTQKENSTCDFRMELTLEETKCHAVNPKPVDQCEIREFDETKVKADCNVTISAKQGKCFVHRYLCLSQPDSKEEIAAVCPDCPSLLPLYDSKGMDSIKKALKKFNEQSNQTAYFKLMAVGRLSTQHTFLGQSYFAEFAIVETDCPRQVEATKQDACEALCASEAHHGFCESTLLGNGEVTVECEIYDVQNETDKRCYHHHCYRGPGGKHCGRPGHHSPPGFMPFLPPHFPHPLPRPHPPIFPQPPPRPPPPIFPHHPHHPRPSTPPHYIPLPFLPHRPPMPPFPHCPGHLKFSPYIHPICPPPPHHFPPFGPQPRPEWRPA